MKNLSACAVRGAFALAAYRPAVRQELIQYPPFLLVESPQHLLLPELRAQGLVAVQDLLDLDGVIGHQLGGGVDRGQAAADDAGGQSHLQIRERGLLRRAGQL